MAAQELPPGVEPHPPSPQTLNEAGLRNERKEGENSWDAELYRHDYELRTWAYE